VALRTMTALLGVLMASMLIVYKMRQARSRRRHSRMWALWGTVWAFAVAQLFSVPANAIWIGEFTGISNLARIVTYSVVCAGAGACVTLALLWRYPARSARPKVRRVLTAYGLVIIVLMVLFSLSSVPEERPLDFPIHYSGQPTVAALMVVATVAAAIGYGTLAYWCFAWAGSEDFAGLTWLRRGLRLYGATASTFTLWVSLTLVLTLTAGLSGSDALSPVQARAVNVFSLVSILLLVASLTVPRWPELRNWWGQLRAFFILRPLHGVLRPVAPANVIVAEGKRFSPHHRVRRMVIELNDWRTTLRPHFDPVVRQTAEEHGENSGLTGEGLEAMVEAAQLREAALGWRQGATPSHAPTAAPLDEESIRDGSGSIDAELAWWIHVAQAYKADTPLQRTDASSQAHLH
jgi:uncharacterized protein DUF6545